MAKLMIIAAKGGYFGDKRECKAQLTLAPYAIYVVDNGPGGDCKYIAAQTAEQAIKRGSRIAANRHCEFYDRTKEETTP